MVALARRKKIKIGPKDHGKRMSLDEFDLAEAQEGHLYELNKGVIEVSNVPVPNHGRMVGEIRTQFVLYEVAHPGVIDYMSGGSDAKLLIGESQSERHPDWLVYLTPAPLEGNAAWSVWIPEIVIEVVSESSAKRDYEDKPAEYFEFGVKEYWIVDPLKNIMTVLTRWRGMQWQTKVVKASQKYSTVLLPGFSPNLKAVFATGKK